MRSDGACERDELIRRLAQALGYQRVGHRIGEVLESAVTSAIRRGILVNEEGVLRIQTDDLRDFTRDSLKEVFLAAIGRSWIDREEAIRAFARYQGFARTGPAIDETARSLINGLLREGRLEADRENRLRKARSD